VDEAERIAGGGDADRLLMLEAHQDGRSPQRPEPETAGAERNPFEPCRPAC
jgi:hypothetical protein